jgi:hypothetical protein
VHQPFEKVEAMVVALNEMAFRFPLTPR